MAKWTIRIWWPFFLTIVVTLVALTLSWRDYSGALWINIFSARVQSYIVKTCKTGSHDSWLPLSSATLECSEITNEKLLSAWTKHVSRNRQNNILMSFFSHCHDSELVTKLNSWSEFDDSDTPNPITHFYVGLAYYRQGQLDSALRWWRSVKILDTAFANWGSYANSRGNDNEALHYFQLAEKINPRVTAEKTLMYRDLCIMYRDGDNLEGAVTYCEKLVEADVSAQGYLLLGTVYSRFGRYVDAIRAYDRALQYESENASIYTHKGEVYESLNKNNEAIELYSRAIQVDPTYPWSYIQLGETYVKKGDISKAEESFNAVLKLDDSPPAVQIAEKWLARIESSNSD